jgi:hypothetical protein
MKGGDHAHSRAPACPSRLAAGADAAAVDLHFIPNDSRVGDFHQRRDAADIPDAAANDVAL